MQKTSQMLLSKFLSVFIIVLILVLAAVWSCPVFAAASSAKATNPANSANSKDLSQVTFAVKVKVSGPNTKVSWPKIEKAKYYKVWRSTTKKGKKKLLKKKTTSRSYVDKKGKSGKTYFYHVQAVNGSSRSELMISKKFQTVTRVYVETGHGTGTDGRWDPGCQWNGYQEAKIMIPIAKATSDYLKKNDIYVYTDAYDGNNRNLKYTLNFLDNHSVSLFLNLHCDSPIEDAGTLTLYRTKEQKALGKAINKAVHKYVTIDDRGYEKRKDLDTLNSSQVHCPACLYEAGNMEKDNKTLRKKTDAYGKGIANGICDYLGLEFTP